jgi:transaldolase
MKLFVDTANLTNIDTALKGGYIRGITTNPSLLAKEPRGSYLDHMKKIIDLILKNNAADVSLSIEVFSNDHQQMITQAEDFIRQLHYSKLAIKIPVSYAGQDNLAVVKQLTGSGIAVNCTACMTPLQAAMAAAAGARYVSIFYNRLQDAKTEAKFDEKRSLALNKKVIEDTDFNAVQVIHETRTLIAPYQQAEIITGSIRTSLDVKHASLAGSHIVTASLKILQQALMHFKTDESIEGFLNDFAAWMT